MAVEIIPDRAKIVPYSPEANSEKREASVRSYRNAEKELLYINASHEKGHDNPLCHLIQEAVENLSPQRIVVEGRPGLPAHGEVTFTQALAHQQGIPVVCAEPDDAQLFKAMKEECAPQEIMALYLLRTVPQDRNLGRKMDEASFAPRAEHYLASHPAFQSLEPSERLDYETFLREYAPKLEGKPFLEAVENDFAPYITEDAGYFQKLHGKIALAREGMVNEAIASALNAPEVERVLVVYGGTHRLMSEPVWEAALGKGVDIDPALEKARRLFHAGQNASVEGTQEASQGKVREGFER